MNVLVLNGSPSGENSITLYTVHYIAEQFPDCTFETLNVGQQIRKLEQDKASYLSRLEQADLLLFTYPVYTFLVPSQLHRFIELMKASGLDLSGKWAAQITTSKHFYDVTAHKFIEENCKDLGLKYIGGLSADMEDLLTKKGRKEAYAFFHFVRWNMIKEGRRNPSHQEGSVVIVTDSEGLQESPLQNMIAAFRAVLPIETTVVDLHEFPFAGGCLGCFNCAADGTCIYKDGFDTYLREHIQSADAIVYAYTIRDHSMGHRFKVYDDRQFCNGHRTVTMGKPVGYLVEGALEQEANLQMLMEARAEVGGNFLVGIANESEEILSLAETLAYALRHHYTQPANFYGVGGMKIFRDLIYQMQGLMREDHRFYKKHGFYDDYPQKHKAKIAAMYLVGGMMRNKKLKKKIGGSMTQGMIMPYQNVIKKK